MESSNLTEKELKELNGDPEVMTVEKSAAVDIPKTEYFYLFRFSTQIKLAIENKLTELGITISHPERLINNTQLRNEIIRQQYREGRARGVKSERLICDLSLQYETSYLFMRKIVKGQI